MSAHRAAIGGVGLAFVLSCVVAWDVFAGNHFNGPVYTWAISGGTHFEIGFLIDPLSAVMMVIVTFVSLMVHIYTIGYMAEDPGYARFFSYIALFTFAMLMLVMSNNFLQLFFGWEAVGLVSYLLIGFWYERDSAIRANMKAFLVNRVGDFGFILGIGAVLALFGSLDYQSVFDAAPAFADRTAQGPFGSEWHWLTLILLSVCRRDGEIRPGAASCLASGFHGRSDPDLSPHSCGDHGHGGHLPSSTDVSII